MSERFGDKTKEYLADLYQTSTAFKILVFPYTMWRGICNMCKSMSEGFTLIELMIVVAIIGIIASVAIPAYNEYQCLNNQEWFEEKRDFCVESLRRANKLDELKWDQYVPPVEPTPQPVVTEPTSNSVILEKKTLNCEEYLCNAKGDCISASKFGGIVH